MPELPEVETVRRGLAPALEGQRFVKVELRRCDLRFPFPERFAARLKGRRVEKLERRAKYLMARLDNGLALIMHLGMTGRFAFGAAPGDKHDHVLFTMSNGAVIRYNDVRRFGFMFLAPWSELDSHPLFSGLGAEPLGEDFDAACLMAKARGRTAPLKSFLLDQRVVAGLGNIYVCEALHEARLSPLAPASVLGEPGKARRLAAAIRKVLKAAIAAGGSSLKDYRQADGSPGYFQHRFAVYGREGEPCKRRGCGGTIARTVQNGRATFYCSRCQT
jgi:formamidopyrimidine-DNA glycosylase